PRWPLKVQVSAIGPARNRAAIDPARCWYCKNTCNRLRSLLRWPRSEAPAPVVDQAASLQDVVTEAFARLSPKQQRVARFLAVNAEVAAFTPATDIAARLRVDPATVVRLAKSLGFQGYPDLQRHLRARFPHHYPAFAGSA